MTAKWSPGASNADWLMPPQWVFDEPVPEHPVAVPAGNGRPVFVPYRYRGSDFSLPDEITVTATRPRRPVVREATALDDPALRYTGVPVSRPRGWGDQ